MKATNIILQGLPADIYSLVNHHRVAKRFIGESSVTDARYLFDKAGKRLINDMNIYKMKMEQFQVNTKFLNTLPPEWSKFVTDVKLLKDLHTSNFDQIQHILNKHTTYANEVPYYAENVMTNIYRDNEISSDSNIIPYSQYLQETQQATVQDTNLQAQQESNGF
ncbi:hypothetical protein Tco_0299411 [Tanacetum coccineum]